MLILYVGYIVVMTFNVRLRDLAVSVLPLEKLGLPNPDPEAMKLNAQPTNYGTTGKQKFRTVTLLSLALKNSATGPHTGDMKALIWTTPPQGDDWLVPSEDFYKISMYEAANHQIIEHRWLFRPRSRFIAAVNLVRARIWKHKVYARLSARAAAGPTKAQLKRALTAVRQDTITAPGQSSVGAPEVTVTDLWMMAPNPLVEGWFPVVKW